MVMLIIINHPHNHNHYRLFCHHRHHHLSHYHHHYIKTSEGQATIVTCHLRKLQFWSWTLHKVNVFDFYFSPKDCLERPSGFCFERKLSHPRHSVAFHQLVMLPLASLPLLTMVVLRPHGGSRKILVGKEMSLQNNVMSKIGT